MSFSYTEKETNYLKAKDKKLGAIIDQIGHINRMVDLDLFSSVIHQIIGQQISIAAQETIWHRMQDSLGTVNADTVFKADRRYLHSFGMSYRKADYIREFSKKVVSGVFDLEGLRDKSDEQAIAELTSLKGIGVWTAEMILLFCLERPNIFSFQDLGIQRGLCMVYHHSKISRELFEHYRKR